MIQDILRNKQKLIYDFLHNALVSDCLSHAYLFTGDNDSLKKDTAFLLAQSIIEGRKDFACEQCDTCIRIKNNAYADILYFDGGEKGDIRVDDIRRIISEFQKTPVEKAARKIYIINNFDNINKVAANAFLKFIEEPTRNTYGIIIVNNKDNVIDTIKSRCQIVNFKSSSFDDLYQDYAKKDISETDKYLLSRLKISDVAVAEDESYQSAYDLFQEYLKLHHDFDDFIFYVFNNYYNNFKNIKDRDLSKTMQISASKYFLRILVVFYTDVLYSETAVSDSYDREVNKFRKENRDMVSLIEIALDTLKELDYRPFSHNLTMDKLLYRLKKGEQR